MNVALDIAALPIRCSVRFNDSARFELVAGAAVGAFGSAVIVQFQKYAWM